MSVLSVAGVELPVAVDSLRLSLEAVGSASRNPRGHRVLDRRASKWTFEFALPPKPLDEAMLYRSLILGEGEFWSPTLASGVYGSKGLALTGTGSVQLVANPLGPAGWLTYTGQTLIVPGRFSSQTAVGGAAAGIAGATLFGWQYDFGTLTWRLFGWSWRSADSVTTNRREKVGALGSSGAAQAWSGSGTLSVSGGALTFTAPGSGGPWAFSNLLVVPWFLSSSLIDRVLDGLAGVRQVLPMLPRVYVMSDLFPTEQLSSPAGSNQSAIICHGDVTDMQVVPLHRSGAFSTTECQLVGTLTEV